MWITCINLYTMTNVTLDENKLWKAVLAEMEVNVSNLNYEVFLTKTKIDKVAEDYIEIACTSAHIKARVEKVFKELILESITKITKKPYELRFKVGDIKTDRQKTDDLNTPLFKPLKDEQTKYIKQTPNHAQAGLNPEYTFEKYIMGSANRLAYAIASNIADNPGKMYNPYFLYSGVGQGKTHLVQAIGNKILETHPNLKVLYCTGEQFTNELIELLRKGKSKNSYGTDEFRKKYRNTDVLIIDDIQFIAGKEATQEEVFHTFNDLYMKNKQIILTSDRPPEEFKNIEERLTSRFKSGIMADIQKPDFELRTAILRAKRDYEQDTFPNDIIEFIAENVATNIRELEGAYLQVLTHAKAGGQPLSLDLAKDILSNILPQKRGHPTNINNILKSVCNYYDVKVSEIKGKKRTKDLVIPRQVAMFLIYELTNTPFMGIGDFLGGRDHTTIMHGVKKIQEDMKEMSKMKQDVLNIKQFIYQS